ncbi:MAG: 3-hydroxybutyrate dehydrogenase [Gammaproteobacteria bacterium]|jgi:3-hydroxybutyrate dehydrogenase|nr:3-hydroxybutyrate dehydrogenase [Gammaproteobacteria bacterium]
MVVEYAAGRERLGLTVDHVTPEFGGKSVLITGADRGIGKAIALAFAKTGARVAAHGLADPDEALRLSAELRAAGSPDVRFFGGDLRDVKRIDLLMEQVFAWGPVDILVNNAGIQHTATISGVAVEMWNDILAVNLSAAFHTMRHALPRMADAKYGRVINIASVHGLVASASKAPYVSAKFGLVGLSKVAALEYAAVGSAESGGVTINCICPGWVDTALLTPQIAERREQLGLSTAAALDALLAEKQPSRRLSSPTEVARLAVWLCATAAHNITGTSIPIDGGWTAQ